MRVLEDTKMAGLCNRPQWYLQAAASLVAFYLTHDDSTRLHSRGTLSSAHHFSAEHRPSRTHRQHARPRPGTDMSLRRAVKASQSSFHRRSLHGRARNTPWIRKEIKSEERPTNGLPPGHAAACTASGHSFHARAPSAASVAAKWESEPSSSPRFHVSADS